MSLDHNNALSIDDHLELMKKVIFESPEEPEHGDLEKMMNSYVHIKSLQDIIQKHDFELEKDFPPRPALAETQVGEINKAVSGIETFFMRLSEPQQAIDKFNSENNLKFDDKDIEQKKEIVQKMGMQQKFGTLASYGLGRSIDISLVEKLDEKCVGNFPPEAKEQMSELITTIKNSNTAGVFGPMQEILEKGLNKHFGIVPAIEVDADAVPVSRANR